MAHPHAVLLLDFDGVINDPAAMLKQYGQVVAKAMSKTFGGEPEAWLEAHNLVMRAMVTWSTDIHDEVHGEYRYYYREENRRWIVAMFRYLKRQPPEEMECQKLADRLRFVVPSQIKTPMPGGLEAVHALHRAGHCLILASAGCHAHCKGALKGLGLLDKFKRVYGADLVNTFKDGPGFYDRLMDQEELEPGECVVVDDKPRVLAWARDLGLRTIQVVLPGKAVDKEAAEVVRSPTDLPHAVQRVLAGP